MNGLLVFLCIFLFYVIMCFLYPLHFVFVVVACWHCLVHSCSCCCHHTCLLKGTGTVLAALREMGVLDLASCSWMNSVCLILRGDTMLRELVGFILGGVLFSTLAGLLVS